MKTWIVLYSADGLFRWLSYPPPPPYRRRDLIDHHPTEFLPLADRERWNVAFARAAKGRRQRIDLQTELIGKWRIDLTPVKGFDGFVVIGIARQHPAEAVRLTKRERQICAEVAKGRSSKQIAAKLGIARSTVDNHRHRIARRLNIPPSGLAGWCGLYCEWLD